MHTHIFLMDHIVLHRRFISVMNAHSSRNLPSCNLLAFVHRKPTRTKVDEKEQATDNGEGLEKVVAQKVALRQG